MNSSATVSLFQKYGIQSSDPIERFWENPCSQTFMKIGKAQQTAEMLDLAIKHYKGPNPILGCVSKKLMTYEICLACCELCGSNLQYVPKEYLDRQMCLAAVSNDASALIVNDISFCA